MSDNIVSIFNKNKETDIKKSVDEPYNIIDIRWFRSNKVIGMEDDLPIGIVLVEDPTMKYTFAIMGIGNDPQTIAAWGSHIDRKMAEGTFGYQMNDYKVR